MTKSAIALRFYARFMRIAHVLAPTLLRRRLKAGKEDPARYRERLGQTQTARPPGPLIWINAVSVGESLSCLPVIMALARLRPDITILITTATITSAALLRQRLPASALHQFTPIDTPQAVAKFLRHWQPDLGIFIESDLWPNMLQGLDKRGVKRCLLSARITDKTFRGWARFPKSVYKLLSGFSLIMAQDEASQNRLSSLGLKLGAKISFKRLGEILPDNSQARTALKSAMGKRNIILAASTHAGEDILITEALRPMIIDQYQLLIIVPRHPDRAANLAEDLQALGFRVALRSNQDNILPDTQIYVADTLGELGIFFRLADSVIMGGSFSQNIGGHNPLEATRLGKAVITGPDIYNWAEIYEELMVAGAAFKVGNRSELAFFMQQMSNAPETLRQAHAAALASCEQASGLLESLMSALGPHLPLPHLPSKPSHAT
jgi:3-deoxy-D-manno-octulosonic-acid transferase